MSTVLPYKVKSFSNDDIFQCTKCGKNGKAHTLWLAEMVQSTTDDAMIPRWYDIDCFFSITKLTDVNQLNGFAKLCNEDRAAIKRHLTTSVQQTRKRRLSQSDPLPAKKFGVDYAPGHSVCYGCFRAIVSNDIRIKKTIVENENRSDDSALWYHLNCFSEHSSTLGWNNAVKYMPGLTLLTNKDQATVKRKFGANNDNRDQNNNEPPAKKHKTGTIDDVNEVIESVISVQNKEFFDLRTDLEHYVLLADLIKLLQANGQFLPEGKSNILDHVADVLYFGALEKCNKCKNGRFIFDNSSYVCTGYVSAYFNCTNVVKVPQRKAVTIPYEVANAYPTIMQKHTFQVKNRAVLINADTSNADTSFKKAKAIDYLRPLAGLEFVVVGRRPTRMKIKEKIHRMGGNVTLTVTNKTAAIIANEEKMWQGGYVIQQAEQYGIPMVPENFPEVLKNGHPFDIIANLNFSYWTCTDLSERTQGTEKIEQTDDDEERYTKSVPRLQKWKNGTVIDAECDLKNVHVYSHNRMIYNATMALVDIASNKNSYYRMQVLRSNDLKRCWVFWKHGRIATNIGKRTLKEYKGINVAVAVFRRLFFELTGNEFSAQIGVKRLHKYKVLDIQVDEKQDVLKNLANTNMEPSVCRLINLIDRKHSTKNAMFKFELDMDLVPLGKPSDYQIYLASKILEQLSALVTNNGSPEKLTEISNRFYTYIPHAFGCRVPPVINTAEMIANKSQMLERIQQLNFSYDFLSEGDDQRNPYECLYEKLNCEIKELDKNSDEYGEISKYVESTTYDDDDCYVYPNIRLKKIFKISRHGEIERFKPHQTDSNRQLLWHGSLIKNFVSILSNGLVIEPPGVKNKPFFYGRGIYFADSISNSACYCDQNGAQLLLLCEVALGKSHLQYRINERLEVPKDCISVNAVGRYCPKSFHIRENGLKIPNGPLEFRKNPKSTNERDSYDEYDSDDDSDYYNFHYTDAHMNEFVARDPSQVKMQYIVLLRSREQCEDSDSESDSDSDAVFDSGEESDHSNNST